MVVHSSHKIQGGGHSFKAHPYAVKPDDHISLTARKTPNQNPLTLARTSIKSFLFAPCLSASSSKSESESLALPQACSQV
ncbi:hypothetical protein Ct61P_14549 [Colletotrichum tofieldiae]|nr:hypothetical protein Ct61P_14549 [Colletotrichum tofieldiae]